MKLLSAPTQSEAFSLVMTVGVSAGVFVLIGSILYVTSAHRQLSHRALEYDLTTGAGLAATEKVSAALSRDFQLGGASQVMAQLSSYRQLVPTAEEVLASLTGLLDDSSSAGAWSNFQFSDANRLLDMTTVEPTATWAFTDLQTRFTGLRGYAATYRVVSNARQKDSSYKILSAVRQDIQVASIPIFQYQLFYLPDLEVHPGGTMTFDGPVHGNRHIYCQGKGVTFADHVTAAGRIVQGKHPEDPVSRSTTTVGYQAERVGGVKTLNLPIGATNTVEILRAIVETPKWFESPGSPLGQQRIYNKADLIVLVSDSGILARSGIYNGSAVVIPWIQSRGIVTIAGKVYNKRECKDANLTHLDIDRFLASYDHLTLLLGRPVKTIWIGDFRSQSATSQPGIRLLNAAILPSAGLTVATPHPLYTLGDFNKSGAAPAALMADAVTVLSVQWADGNGPKDLSSRKAANTTVNAAVVTGIVPTGNGYYSGGAENALRLLEDWSGRTLTFNGSIAVLFESKVATAPWGASADVYVPPVRDWSYNRAFKNAEGLPPSTPEVRTVFRGGWNTVKSNGSL